VSAPGLHPVSHLLNELKSAPGRPHPVMPPACCCRCSATAACLCLSSACRWTVQGFDCCFPPPLTYQ
jgi:hypothetical protein